jgi:hypothetical protein
MASASVARRYRGMDEHDRLVEGEKMLAMYNKGARLSELAKAFGYSGNTIRNRIDQATAARIAPTVDKYRMIQGEAIDTQLARVEEQLENVDRFLLLAVEQKDAALIEKGLAQRLHAIEARNRVLMMRAKLFGLDMPVKAEVSVVVTTPIDSAVDALMTQLQDTDA